MNKSKYLLKNMGILTISNFSSKLLVFLLVPLYTNVLTTAEYGEFDIAVSTATLFYPILTLNVTDAVMRFSMDEKYDKKSIASIAIKFVLIGILFFGIGMCFLQISKLWGSVHGLEAYIFGYYVVYVLNQFFIQFAKGLEKVKEMGIAGIISTLVTVLTNILFLLVFKWGLIGFFIANILSQFVSGVYLAIIIKIWKYIDLRSYNNSLQKEMMMYSLPLIATVVGWWINSTADKYVVIFMLGASANGLLSVSYKIPQIINTLQGIFTQAWQISAIKEYGQGDTSKFYGDIFTSINLLMCAACSWLIILTRPLSHLLFSKDFYDAWEFVPILLVASVFNCASGLLGPILAAQKKSKAMMWSAVIGASVNIVLNFIFVHYFGIQGATIATVICSYVIYIVRRKAVGTDISFRYYKLIVLTWILICVQAIIESYFQYYLLEICIMVVLLAMNFRLLRQLFQKCYKIVASKKNKKYGD